MRPFKIEARLVFVGRYVLQYDAYVSTKDHISSVLHKTETGPSQPQKTAPSLILTPHATSCLVYMFYSLE